jgi:hypothetical protein
MTDDSPILTEEKALHRVENVKYDAYAAFLAEPSRPPSRGGNTRANHQHRMTIDKKIYSWLGLGSKQWVFKTDTVSFVWNLDPSGKYRNVIPESIEVIDKDGKPVVRGERGSKKWRTAETRAPVSRREWRD